jgi:hypothetical protein
VEIVASPLATLLGILVAAYGVVYTVTANTDSQRQAQKEAPALHNWHSDAPGAILVRVRWPKERLAGGGHGA